MSLHTQILLHGDITEAETETERQYKRLPSTSRSSLPTLRSDRCDRSRRPAPNLRSRGRSRPAAPGAASRGRQPPAARATRKAAGKGKMEGKSPRGTRGLSATGCSFGWVQNPPPRQRELMGSLPAGGLGSEKSPTSRRNIKIQGIYPPYVKPDLG